VEGWSSIEKAERSQAMNVYYIVTERVITDSFVRGTVTGKLYVSPKEAIRGLEKSPEGIPNCKLFILCWHMTEKEIINELNSRDRCADYLPGTTRKINPATVFAEIKKSLQIELYETESDGDERLEQ